jgi:beta-1,4-mannosyltransferase
MAYPIPVITQTNAAQTLAKLYLNIERSHPCPQGTEPSLLVTLPTVWANKYQILLYGSAARHRFAVAGVTTPQDLDHISWPGPVILHTHWFGALFQGAANAREADYKLEQIKDSILRFRDRVDARVIWTAHNVFPHGNEHTDAFLKLRQWIFETFDAVHIMEDHHLPVLERSFERKAPRVFTVPHMLYTGSLLNSVDQVMARAHFGLPVKATVFGYFGSIQAYKRIPMLIDAMDKLPSTKPAVVLIGGLASDQKVLRELQLKIGNRSDIILIPRKIHDHEIQYLHQASDVMVLPYCETLNSGAAMMAASFRRPFIMPQGSTAKSLEPLGAQSFDGDNPDDLARVMALYAQDPQPELQIDEKAWHAKQPEQVSEKFFMDLERLY